jgi:nucleoid-associated protein YgaU
LRYFIVLAAAVVLIGGAVALLTQPTPAPEREAAATAPREAAPADPTRSSPPLPNAGRDERIAAAPVGAAGGPVVAAVDPTPAGRAGQAAVKAAIDPRDPTFDIVRITRGGNAVIAGRAEPGAEVTVREQGQTLGTTRADARGEWVLIPAEPLAPGATQLTTVAALPGAETRQSNDVVILSVPQREVTVGEAPAIAILSSRQPERAARVLQGPLGPVLRADGGAGVGLDIVDYDERGDVVFAGRAEPNVLVRLYADNEMVGTTTADAAGDWQLTADRPIAPGDHEVRVDAVTNSGEVLGRVAMPFTRAAVSSIALRDDRVIVQPGNSLWRIARATLGEGIRYTVIYEANRERIRDPNLIYPGQIFSIPATN